MTPETITFMASDGWPIEASVFRGPDPGVAILISSGTGFRRQFYHDLAAILAARGAIVLTYDYRGIGGSAAKDIATSGIDYPDWGRFDLVAAIDALAKAAPNSAITHLAHSVGGHFVGLAANHSKIARHAFVSVGTGYIGKHHVRNMPTELYFWWILGTYSLAKYGHIAQVGGWKGEPLPPKLFRTWRRWSRTPSYFQSDIGGFLSPDHYAEVTAPIRSWLFPDDPIATPSTARDLLRCYPNAPHEIMFKTPADIGVRRIGHDGAIRKGREKLWDEFWEWLCEA